MYSVNIINTEEARHANCGFTPEDTKYILQCPLLAQLCSLDDLLDFNRIAKNCVKHGKHGI